MKQVKGFTLIELLVAISVVAILAGLTVPFITGAISRTNQTKDLSNIKQLAQVLLMDANDNNGLFRRNEDLDATDNAASSTIVFRGLLKDGVLTTPDVLAGYAVQAFEDGTNYDNLAADNVSWNYFAGLSVEDNDRLPLLISKGNDNIDKSTLTNDLAEVELDGTGVWGKKGVVIAYKGQNAEFKKAKDSKVELGSGVETIDAGSALLEP